LECPEGLRLRHHHDVANEIDARLTYINGPEIVGTYSGQTEENLRKIFGEASLEPPSIIFIDEVDAIAPVRGATGTRSDLRAVTQLLALMDGLKRRRESSSSAPPIASRRSIQRCGGRVGSSRRATWKLRYCG
jgi:SpoVK/Ycf46/Vps4 family AAA+-type ATPase